MPLELYKYDPSINYASLRFLTEDGIKIGREGQKEVISLPHEDLEGHAVIIGKTGTGKSNLLANICKEIIKKNLGNLVLIDPHGSLSDLVMSGTEDDKLIYISPESVEKGGKKISIGFNSIGFNGENELEAESIIGWIRDLFAYESSFSQGTWGPRIELIFRSLLKELMMTRKNSNLYDLAKLLIDNSEMRRFLKESKNMEFRKFIETQMKDWRNWIQYSTSSLNKLLPVVTSPSIKNLISSRKDSFDFYSTLKSGNKVVVVEVSKGLLSEEISRMISTLLLLKLWNLFLSEIRKKEDKIITYVVVDEAQNIPHRILQKMLSEGRKYGFRLILSNQYIEQIEKDYVKSLFGNVRNFISFSVSRDDATSLSSTFALTEISKRFIYVLLSQKIHRAVIWNHTEAGISGPVSFTPFIVEDEIDLNEVEAKKRRSIIKYGNAEQDNSAVGQDEEMDLHETLLRSFSEYLERKSVKFEQEERIGTTVPDANFYFRGKQVVLEVEVSDLLKKIRILRKIRDYAGRKIIFLTNSGDSMKLFKMIVEGNDYKFRDGMMLEVPTFEGAEKIYMKDLGDYLGNLYLLERSKSGFCIFDGEKCTRFSLNDLDGDSSLERSLKRLEFPELRLHLFSQMVSGGVYCMRVEDLSSLTIFDRKAVDMLRSNFIKQGKEIIKARDLFTEA